MEAKVYSNLKNIVGSAIAADIIEDQVSSGKNLLPPDSQQCLMVTETKTETVYYHPAMTSFTKTTTIFEYENHLT